mmetsp:Transcript_86639/g.197731  ORF Transcript_86639/g.197731 Transcript_86639/m.197731 type:complete len:371 (+) Transcript_86639:52-1164(+)
MVLSRGGLRLCKGPPAPKGGISWETIGFGLRKDSQMARAVWADGRWGEVEVTPYGPLPMEPGATALNYGQSLFEGMKATRTSKGRVALFRPGKNAQRMQAGGRRFLMPALPSSLFLDTVRHCVVANGELIPPHGKGSLYLRPLYFGSGAGLGVAPSTEYTFVTFGSPVGGYFTPGSGRGARMKLELSHQRAAPKGVGYVKAAGNYAPCFASQQKAKAEGFNDVIYADVTATYIEEVAAANMFVVTKDGTVYTPDLGQILPGVTRDSIIQIVGKLMPELKLVVGQVPLDVLFEAEEAFCCGTAAVLTSIEHVSDGTRHRDFTPMGPVTSRIYKILTGIQNETHPDEFGWLVDPFDTDALARAAAESDGTAV